MAKLTALKVKHATEPGRYGDGGGLWLQVRTPVNRSWIFRYHVDGRVREMGLGPAADVGLAEAREAARKARNMLREGIDPLEARRQVVEARRAAADVLTFAEVVARYLAAHTPSWSNDKHAWQWKATLGLATEAFGKRLVNTIGTGDVLKVLEPIWREKPETASRLRGRLEAVLDYAAARGWRSGQNPAAWRGHLDKLLPARSKVAAVVHQPALPWQEVPAFLIDLDKQVGIAALALRFAILTAARSGEVLGMTWAEVDLAEALWTVPARRMKGRKPHRVPLSDEALAVLDRVALLRHDDDDPVFPGNQDRPLSGMAMLMVLRRMNPDKPEAPARWRDPVSGKPVTTHGFRSSFRSWCAEMTAYPREVAEAALAHTLPDAVERAYQRSDLFDRRGRLMAEWGRFCTQPPVVGEVIPIRA